jgi:hypothetical protein
MPSKTREKADDVECFADKYRLKTRISEDGTKIIPGRYGQIYEYSPHLLGVLVTPHPPHGVLKSRLDRI